MKCRKKTIFIISILVSLSCIYQPVFAEDIIPEEAKTEETSEPQPEENDEGISEEESRSDEAVEETPELEEAEIAEEVSGNEDQTVETDEGENLPEDTDTADISTETIIDEQTEENVGEENVNNDDNTEIDTPSEKIDDIRESLKSIDLLKTEKVLQTESSINSGVDYEYADSTDRANKLREFKYIPITFTDKDGLSCGYFYNDGMMLADARDLSVDLALVAANLADAAYSSAVATRLTDMGYSLYHGDTYNYTKEVTYEDNDSVAFAIGHKPIIYGEITYNAYIIAIRGTSKNAEWYSDFNLGKRSDGYHEGFRVAAEDIFNAIRTIQTDNNIFLVTGHSRGAAVANIIAGELSTNSEYRNMVSEDHVFGYTYACPAVSDQLSESDLALRNIYNFNNAGDAIPELPLASWGYKRYGKTLKLETADGQFENLKQRFNTELKEEYAGLLSTTSYLSTISILAKEKQDFYSPTNQLIFDVGAWFLGTKDTGDLVKILLRHNVKGILKYNILKFIGSGIVGELQYHFDNNQKESLELLARVDTELDTTSEYDQEAFDQWITSNSELVKQLKEETEIEIKTRDDLYQARTEIAESMSKLSSFNANLETVLSLWYTSDGDLKNSIFHAHQPQTYVLWINSMFYGYKGWMNNTELEHFDTGEHYFSIGSNCFSNIPNLSDITLRDNAMILGDNAFSGCSQLTKVILPVDMVYTWNGTKDVSPFASDVNIEEIVYKAGKSGEMPDIGKGAVTGAVTVGNDGKLNSLNRIEYIARNAVGKIVYEEGITKISANACSPEFNHYGSDTRVSMEVLKTVDLPSTLKTIGAYAFFGMQGDFIESGLPSLKETGAYAFYNCTNISAAMPVLEIVGMYTFYNCKGLNEEDIILPGKIKDFPTYSFYGCIGLQKEINLAGDEKLDDQCFGNMSQLKKVTIPVDMLYTWNGTKDVSPFASDVNIEEIVYKAGKSGEMPDIGKGAVTGAVTVGNDGKLNSLNRIEYIARNAVGKIVYEEGITKISANACSPEFNHYGSDTRVSMEVLKTVDLPSTLEKVGDYAFYGSKITSAYLLRNVKEIGSYAFDGISNLTMYVYRNTYAHQYALTNNKNYVLLDPAATAISLPSEKEMPLGSTEQLTITYTPADATDPIFWVSSDESIVSIDENGNAKALSTGTAIITATTDTGLSAQSVITVSSKGVSVYGTSLALEGKIGINFYLNIAEEELEYLNVVMTMNGQTTTVPASEGKASTVGGQKLRMFVYPVAAKEMRDKVTLTVEDAEGNKIKLAKDETDYTEGYPFSAADYFARAEEAGSEKTKKLARVLNNYGKYAQIYFNHNPEEVTDLTDVSAVTLETLAPYQAVQTENQVAGLTYVGGTTMLDDAIGYRLYFKIDTSHKISDYTFKMDGKVVTPVKSGSQYYIEKTDIAAKDLGVKNKIEVTDGTNTFGIQYCALSYAYRALELTAEDKIPLQNMCRAMYLYNQQAIEYFNS